jgi:hypothetical protein
MSFNMGTTSAFAADLTATAAGYLWENGLNLNALLVSSVLFVLVFACDRKFSTKVHVFVDNSNIAIGAGSQRSLNFGGLLQLARRPRVHSLCWMRFPRQRALGQAFLAGSNLSAGFRAAAQEAGFQTTSSERQHGREQGVDETIHAQMLALAPVSWRCRAPVIALFTGDGNANSGLTSFPDALRACSDRGYTVELHTWRKSMASAYTEMKGLRIIYLDDHLGLVSRAPDGSKGGKGGKGAAPDSSQRGNSGSAKCGKGSGGASGGWRQLDLSPAALAATALPIQGALGTVRSIKEFGAFVDFGCKSDGLLHIKEVGGSRGADPFRRLADAGIFVGAHIGVDVLQVDAATGRIALGRSGGAVAGAEAGGGTSGGRGREGSKAAVTVKAEKARAVKALASQQQAQDQRWAQQLEQQRAEAAEEKAQATVDRTAAAASEAGLRKENVALKAQLRREEVQGGSAVAAVKATAAKQQQAQDQRWLQQLQQQRAEAAAEKDQAAAASEAARNEARELHREIEALKTQVRRQTEERQRERDVGHSAIAAAMATLGAVQRQGSGGNDDTSDQAAATRAKQGAWPRGEQPCASAPAPGAGR